MIAANGMDAFTQLLESYVSIHANAFTDALAWSGMEAVRDGFLAAFHGGDSDAARLGRACMSYAALLSGITLAQAGLGSVHGLASPLGAYFPIPHGVVCGTLVATATEANIRALRERTPRVSRSRNTRAWRSCLPGNPFPVPRPRGRRSCKSCMTGRSGLASADWDLTASKRPTFPGSSPARAGRA